MHATDLQTAPLKSRRRPKVRTGKFSDFPQNRTGTNPPVAEKPASAKSLFGAKTRAGTCIREKVLDAGDVVTDTKYYAWGLDLSQSTQGAGGVGGLVAMMDGDAGTTYYYAYDANGNVGQLVDGSDDSIAARYEYDAFGGEIVSDGVMAQENAYRFSTKYFIPELGVYDYGYRLYEPQLGRWLSRDPYEEFGGLNLYSAVLNDPVNDFDVLGQWAFIGIGIDFIKDIANAATSTVSSWWDGIRNPKPDQPRLLYQESGHEGTMVFEYDDDIRDYHTFNVDLENELWNRKEHRKAVAERQLANAKGYFAACKYIKAYSFWGQYNATKRAENVGDMVIDDKVVYTAEQKLEAYELGMSYAVGGGGGTGYGSLASRSTRLLESSRSYSRTSTVLDSVRRPNAIQKYYPIDNGALGNTTREFLYAGEKIDRYGGSAYSRFFSPQGTPAAARALPPGTAGQPLRTFRVLKPFEVEATTVAPAFQQLGLGTQYYTPVSLRTLLNRGIIKEIVP